MKRLGLIALLATGMQAQAQTGRVNVIPAPVQVQEQTGQFTITPQTAITADAPFGEVATLLSEHSGMPFRKAGMGNVRILREITRQVADSAAYRLLIGPKEIRIYASGRAGALHGIYTLLQIMATQPDPNILPAVALSDRPRFGYRGLHLDVSRHFFPLTFVYKYIDLMAMYKMNVFHWHITDGAGWRLEIKKYPALTQKAAWRTHANYMEWWKSPRHYVEEGNPNAYGGFYTQDEARAVVAYAARRGITVIPEIEMPGHSEEVLAVYPHLSCAGEPYKQSEFCLGNDSTFTFLEDVLREVMDIFPSQYIHIGGDEADKSAWKKCPKCQRRMKEHGLANEEALQSYAVKRMEKFLIAHNRKLMGWDEILEGGLAPEATVMSWRGEKGGITAASEGHDVVMTPGGYCYFDSYQSDPSTEPLTIGGYLPLSKVYAYEPIPAELPAEKAHHVLGAQANVWAEYMPTTYQVEYMVFPRMIALSEVLWSQKEKRGWEDFKTRLQAHYRLLQRKQVNYYRPSWQLEPKTVIDTVRKQTIVSFQTEQFQPVVRYTLDGSRPTANSTLYVKPVEVPGTATLTAAIFRDTMLMGRPVTVPVNYHKAIGKTVIYNAPWSGSYPAQQAQTLVNGYRGSLTYGDGQWQGFLGKGLDVTIDLGESQPLESLSIGFMQLTGPGVYMPPHVQVQVADDVREFALTATVTIPNDVPPTHEKLIFKDFKFDLRGREGRYIRVIAPVQKGFLFTDEIIVY
ncbi:beta-N-acetylhexosaminidase [Chitinophaga caseinilytica]|uniref:beta-N-acetylhexosaminidase n=1 Tax=Chitinophaga caseinilytica TaxID=2267521 RepID=UPI003C2FCEF2